MSSTRDQALTGGDVKAFRAETGHTQASLAAALGVPTRTVVNWENDGARPPVFLARAFASLKAGLEPWRPWAQVDSGGQDREIS